MPVLWSVVRRTLNEGDEGKDLESLRVALWDVCERWIQGPRTYLPILLLVTS